MVTRDGVEVCPCARSSSSRSPEFGRAAAWKAAGLTPAWTKLEHLTKQNAPKERYHSDSATMPFY